METDGLNAFWLISLGAGFFALSFNKGRAGEFRQSVVCAVLAIIAGLAKAEDDGIYNREPGMILAVVCGYVLLPLLGVIVSSRLFQRSLRAPPAKSGG